LSQQKFGHVVAISGSPDFGMAGDLSLLQASRVKPPPREKYAGLKGLGDEWFATSAWQRSSPFHRVAI
jgi:hypothetical protein